MINAAFLGLMLTIASVGFAQGNSLAGVIDIHVHAAPDSTPRSIDAIAPCTTREEPWHARAGAEESL